MQTDRGERVMENNLEFLTERQREAYELRQKNFTFAKIAVKMGITRSRARRLVLDADRRFQEYKAYQKKVTENNQPIIFPINRGELELIVEGMYKLQFEISKRHGGRNVKNSLLDKLPYKAQILDSLIERSEKLLLTSKEMDQEMDLKDKLRIMRKSLGLSQRQIAELLHLERSTYSGYELGRSVPNIIILQRLAQFYNVKVSFLLGENDKL